MPRFIEDFYYENIEPQESNSEFRSVLKKKLDRLTQLEKALSEKLQNEEKELLAEYIEKNLDFLSTSQVDSFVRGFRIGSEFTLVTFMKNIYRSDKFEQKAKSEKCQQKVPYP